MILSMDVAYRSPLAYVAGVAFRAWEDATESAVFVTVVEGDEEYVPGEFCRRELPCLLRLLQEHDLLPRMIIVDGYVYLDGTEKPGLGKHLYDALGGKAGVVGVAKRPFKGISAECELLRGTSRKPLYVSSAGMGIEEAKRCIFSMHGPFRMPDLLRKTDQVCRWMALEQVTAV